MTTLLEILQKTTRFFEEKGIPDPLLDAQYLLAHGLGMSRMDLYLNYDRPLKDPELAVLRSYVLRRSKREPLQHILGTAAFRLNILKSDSRALIPRPETEGLVDHIINSLKGLQELLNRPVRCAEIGVGTGAISLSLAKEFPEGEYWGGDISTDALALAQENANALDVANVSWSHSDLLSGLDSNWVPDIIVSNPPYLSALHMATLQPEVKFDPALALHGGETGLELIQNLLQQAVKRLPEHGELWLEIGYDQGDAMIALGKDCGFKYVSVYKDLEHQDRYVHLKNTL